jgi:hypothetical protein
LDNLQTVAKIAANRGRYHTMYIFVQIFGLSFTRTQTIAWYKYRLMLNKKVTYKKINNEFSYMHTHYAVYRLVPQPQDLLNKSEVTKAK